MSNRVVAEEPRSSRIEVRNPVLLLPGMTRLRALPEPVRVALATILDEIGLDARTRAETCWRKHKGPMAAYWKAVSVYARHIAKALRRPIETPMRQAV